MIKQDCVNSFIDIGNSSTVVVDAINLNILSKISTQKLFNDISLLKVNHFNKCLISSVVPSLNKLILNNYLHVSFINYQNIPFTSIDLAEPKEIGVDRLLSAYAAWKITKKAVLVVDAGSAITFCMVSSNGVYLGGAIVPGLGTSSKALNDYTEKIPCITVKKTRIFDWEKH